MRGAHAPRPPGCPFIGLGDRENARARIIIISRASPPYHPEEGRRAHITHTHGRHRVFRGHHSTAPPTKTFTGPGVPPPPSLYSPYYFYTSHTTNSSRRARSLLLAPPSHFLLFLILYFFFLPIFGLLGICFFRFRTRTWHPRRSIVYSFGAGRENLNRVSRPSACAFHDNNNIFTCWLILRLPRPAVTEGNSVIILSGRTLGKIRYFVVICIIEFIKL